MKRLVILAAGAMLSVAALAQQLPPCGERVVDPTSKLSTSAKAEVEKLSRQFEAQTGGQLITVIWPTIGGESIEHFTITFAKQCKIGQKGTNNGVVLLIAVQEKRIRIEVGYGYESQLPDAKAKRIISSDIAPHLKAGRWDDGVRSGVGAILTTLRR